MRHEFVNERPVAINPGPPNTIQSEIVVTDLGQATVRTLKSTSTSPTHGPAIFGASSAARTALKFSSLIAGADLATISATRSFAPMLRPRSRTVSRPSAGLSVRREIS